MVEESAAAVGGRRVWGRKGTEGGTFPRGDVICYLLLEVRAWGSRFFEKIRRFWGGKLPSFPEFGEMFLISRNKLRLP